MTFPPDSCRRLNRLTALKGQTVKHRFLLRSFSVSFWVDHCSDGISKSGGPVWGTLKNTQVAALSKDPTDDLSLLHLQRWGGWKSSWPSGQVFNLGGWRLPETVQERQNWPGKRAHLGLGMGSEGPKRCLLLPPHFLGHQNSSLILVLNCS